MSALADEQVRALDDALREAGEDIELRRLTGTQQIPVKVGSRAFVRVLGAEDLVGDISQGTSKVIISPTEIIRAGWPGPNSSSTPTTQDRRVPRNGDTCIIAGRPRKLKGDGQPFYVDGELVRIELLVEG